MRTIHILILLFCFLLYVDPASAESDNQSPYKGGLNYIKLKTAAPAQEQPQTNPPSAEPASEPQAEKPTSRVWKKYQALAAGQGDAYEEAQEKSKVMIGTSEQEQQATPEATQPQAKPTGIAAIIEQYQETKQSRSQMRSIHTGASERLKDKKTNATE